VVLAQFKLYQRGVPLCSRPNIGGFIIARKAAVFTELSNTSIVNVALPYIGAGLGHGQTK
jgi:hypothetical protein